MRRPVVLVLGRPASGKTTLARALAASTGLPLLAKDDVKELLFDVVGAGDREWSRRLGRAAYDLLDREIDLQLAGGGPFVVETPFDARVAGPRFAEREARYGPRWIQVVCTAPPEVLLARFVERARSGARHPGHADEGGAEEFAASLRVPRTERFDLPGPVLEVDTTRETPDAAVARIRPLLEDGPGLGS